MWPAGEEVEETIEHYPQDIEEAVEFAHRHKVIIYIYNVMHNIVNTIRSWITIKIVGTRHNAPVNQFNNVTYYEGIFIPYISQPNVIEIIRELKENHTGKITEHLIRPLSRGPDFPYDKALG